MNRTGKNGFTPDELDLIRGIMPEFQKDDGAYNVIGIATRFGMNKDAVRRLIQAVRMEDVNKRVTNYIPDVQALDLGDV
jgi:hypothetical protein